MQKNIKPQKMHVAKNKLESSFERNKPISSPVMCSIVYLKCKFYKDMKVI